MTIMNDYSVFMPKDACRENDAVFGKNVPLAMAYVRDQDWEKPMRAMDALKNGTAFGSLVKPFLGAEVCDEK